MDVRNFEDTSLCLTCSVTRVSLLQSEILDMDRMDHTFLARSKCGCWKKKGEEKGEEETEESEMSERCDFHHVQLQNRKSKADEVD